MTLLHPPFKGLYPRLGRSERSENANESRSGSHGMGPSGGGTCHDLSGRHHGRRASGRLCRRPSRRRHHSVRGRPAGGRERSGPHSRGGRRARPTTCQGPPPGVPAAGQIRSGRRREELRRAATTAGWLTLGCSRLRAGAVLVVQGARRTTVHVVPGGTVPERGR